VTDNKIFTHVCRVFQCYSVDPTGIEAVETDIYFGFKRSYAIDCLGGPPKLVPPTWLAKNNLVLCIVCVCVIHSFILIKMIYLYNINILC